MASLKPKRCLPPSFYGGMAVPSPIPKAFSSLVEDAATQAPLGALLLSPLWSFSNWAWELPLVIGPRWGCAWYRVEAAGAAHVLRHLGSGCLTLPRWPAGPARRLSDPLEVYPSVTGLDAASGRLSRGSRLQPAV